MGHLHDNVILLLQQESWLLIGLNLYEENVQKSKMDTLLGSLL